MACDPTGILREEHALILKVLDVLEVELVDRAEEARPARLRRLVDFFRLFADACHHGKEEGLLFEALVEQGFPRDDGPIAVMLQEHEEGRAHVRGMASALDRLESGETDAWTDLLREGRGYLHLLRNHILREDHGMFEMADRSIDEPRCRRLCDEYESACGRKFEGRTLADLERLAEELIRGTPAER